MSDKWVIKDIDDIGDGFDFGVGMKSKHKYSDLYQKTLDLRIGKGFEVSMNDNRESSNARNAIHSFLRSKGISEKYIVSNRQNKLYVGRVK